MKRPDMDREALLALVERTLDEILPRTSEKPRPLHAAMRYAVGSGGKRIRPLVCLGAAVAAGGRPEDAALPAAAIELIHNYTLVHDDLPAMDDDRERRGRPTVWVEYGEAEAILAGDALLALAFRAAAATPRNAAEVVSVFAKAGVGVVQGQVADLAVSEGEGAKYSAKYVYGRKTGDLFAAAASAGALAAGADAAAVAKLAEFGASLGLAFQYQDDLIDGDGMLSAAATEREAKKCAGTAIAALDGLPGDAAFLRGLVASLDGRRV